MEKRTTDRPGVRLVVPSTRVLPGPHQNGPSLHPLKKDWPYNI